MKKGKAILIVLTALVLICVSAIVGVKYVSAQSATDLPPNDVAQLNAQLDGEKAPLVARYITSTSTTSLGPKIAGTQYSAFCPSGYKFISATCYGSTSSTGETVLTSSGKISSGERAQCSFKNTSTSSTFTIGAAAICMSGI